MKKLFLVNVVCALLLTSFTSFSQQENKKLRIGIFDSRALAIAYGRSADFMKEMNEMKTLHQRAMEEGDSAKVKELAQLGPRKQVLMHQQAFSTGSILNIIEKLKSNIPTIAKENNVSFIVSKWEIVYGDENIELIDLTDKLTDLCNPDEQTLKIIENIKSVEPVPLEEISINPM